MLEFYPMPTNLNHGASLYPHHHPPHHHHGQNHGGARFLDNPNSNLASQNININNNGNSNNNTSGNNNNTMNHHQQMMVSPSLGACPPAQNNHNNSLTTCSTASLTAAAATAQQNNCLPSNAESPQATAISTISNNNNSNSNSNLKTALNSHNSCTSASTSACSSATAPSSCSSTSITSSSSTPTTTPANMLSSTSCSSAQLTTTCTKLSTDCNGRTEVDHIKCEKNFEVCEGCGHKIHDRYLMNVGETNWHENCLSCCYCGLQLHQTCYVRNGKMYCKMDYERIFAFKCAACCHPILPQDMVMRPLPNLIFHLSCFVCFACRIPLQKGEQFMLRDGQILCFRHDLDKEMFLAAAAQHCGYLGLDDDDLMRPRDGRRGPKRPRTILTSAQRKQFKASFEQSPKPCRKVREALAKDTGLSVRVVQVWFQNQRAKMKKIQRKAKNNNNRGGEDKDKEGKDKEGIKQEMGSGSGSENGYLGMDNSYATQPLNPNLPFSPDDYPANSNDSFCSSDLSLDGSNFDHLDDDADSLSLNNLELQSTGSSGHHHNSNPQDILANLNNNLINPIDKLYLMQNSYFQGDS
ncbi:LIM homeobox transcription factor 1-beta [Stomoxys calcitrans]|uniref:LIM homeobox transcription factor 1-beta n=1 Tax=Stomoxys calcitrans TaxID=35570 RepID=UPI0027E2AB42|nr:LIM homeobox transcription factor 1-beta [Stomoxys calcitrans]